jgi:hypothetical protein
MVVEMAGELITKLLLRQLELQIRAAAAVVIISTTTRAEPVVQVLLF